MKVINEKEAFKKIKEGFPIIFQTDTLPAIGCLPKFSEIIYETKKRDKNKPLILMGAETSQILEYVNKSALDDFKYFASKYWPGALTMIIPVSEEKKVNFQASDCTLGIRIPNALRAKSLIKKTGPLVTSSANISGISTSTIAEEVAKKLPDINILGPIPWNKCSGAASTIISWKGKGHWELIRKGQIIISNIF